MMRKVVSILLVAVALLWLGSGVIKAQEPDLKQGDQTIAEQTDDFQKSILSFEDIKPMQQPNLAKLVMRVVVILSLIIVCIIAVVWVLRFFLQDKKNIFNRKERYFEVIDRLCLDHKKTVYLIKIIDEILVVGGTQDGLNLLCKITDQEKVKALNSKEFLPLLDLFHKKIAEQKETGDA